MGEQGSKFSVTAYDVARLAGVSQSAVSRAFTQGASISEATRTKVMAAARELGYRPNLIARSLITRRSNMIGMAVGYMDNQFYPALIEAVGARLSQTGRRLLLFAGEPDGHSDPMLEDVLRYQVDALLLASATLSSHLAADCEAAGIPVVLINRVTEHSGLSSVTGDNAEGARAIGRHFLDTGHQRPAFIAGLENSSTSREREAAFNSVLLEAGMPQPLRAVGHYRIDAARQATRDLLNLADRPDSLFCANDHMAFAAIEVARCEFGLEVGRHISIAGFDDVAMASWPTWSLTSYSQPINLLADAAMKLIDREVQTPERLRIPGELIVRGSSRSL